MYGDLDVLMSRSTDLAGEIAFPIVQTCLGLLALHTECGIPARSSLLGSWGGWRALPILKWVLVFLTCLLNRRAQVA